MTGNRRRFGWMVVLAAGLAGLLVLAWRDGGAEPLRNLAEPVAVPEAAR